MSTEIIYVNAMPMVFSCSLLEQGAAVIISVVFLQSIDPQIITALKN